MSPSSSTSEHPLPRTGGLFDGVLSRGPVGAAVSPSAWPRALLEVEAALALAGADTGAVPPEAAKAIAVACEDDAAYDAGALGRAAAAAGNPVVPLVQAVRAVVGGDAAAWVHLGATSQDVLDSAASLLSRRALALVAADLAAAADAAAGLARRHRDDPALGRTLLQPALPTSFGLVVAGWAVGLDVAAARVRTVAAGLPVQLGGPVGASAGPVRAALAGRLGLAEPLLGWHTLRWPVADTAGCLATASGIVGKIGLDVVLLAQGEVAEVLEGRAGTGGSSSMPHKHNPVAAVSARAGALRAPGLAATLYAAMAQEHQRAAGAWHAEWETLSDLLRCTGSAASWLRECLEHLRVDAPRMLANLLTAGVPGADGGVPPGVGEQVDRVLAAR